MWRVGIVVLMAVALIGSLLYYTLHRTDLLDSVARERQASEAAQQRAVSVGRMAAALGEAAVLGDPEKVQEWIGQTVRVEGLADMLLISEGDRVLASSNPAFIGQDLQDAGWAAIRAQRREWIFVDEPISGQERITVFEPVIAGETLIAWVRVSFLRPRVAELGRTSEDRLFQVLGLLVPVGVLVAGMAWLAMRLATSRMQEQIQSVVAEAMADGPISVYSEAAGQSRPDVGTHRAA